MTTYELETGTLMFIPVPEDSFGHWVNPVIKQLFHYHTPQLEGMSDIDVHTIDLFLHGFKPLSLFSQLKEEDVKEVMPKIHLGAYVNYNKKTRRSKDHDWDFYCDTALQSIHSLAQHLGLDAFNPYGEKRECKGWCLKCDRWQEAQSKVKQYFVVFKAKATAILSQTTAC